MQPNLEKISETIQQFFGVQVESIARRTKFVQRRSKLTGCVFLASIVFSILEKREMTLSSLAQSCLDVGVEITEQGLDQSHQRWKPSLSRGNVDAVSRAFSPN